MNIVLQVMQAAVIAAEIPIAALLILFPAIVGGIALAYQRCKNIGMNPWWSLGIMVPFLNIFVGLRCLAYPEGYEDHKTLDTPAKVILGILVTLLVLMSIAVAVFVA